MRRTWLKLAVLSLLPLGGCGDAASLLEAFVGPGDFALAVFDDGAVKTLALRNVANEDAPVRIITIPTLATTDVIVPARGETRFPVGSFGILEGWLIVETRDPVTGAALPTTGLVEPYLVAQRTGPDVETMYGADFHSQKALMPIFPLTDRVLLLNHSSVGVIFTVRNYGATDGNTPVLLSEVTLAVAADDYEAIDFSPIAAQAGVGHIRVIPPGPGTRFTLASHQDPDLVHEVDDAQRGDSRLLNQGGTLQAELILEYGRDNASGGFIDFHILVTNPTDTNTSFTINNIRDEFGTPIKTIPRTFSLGPNQTRLFATTLTESRGLQATETHPFLEHFGDVFLAAGKVTFHMNLSLGNNLIVAARQFDPLAQEFAAAVRPTAVRRTSSVLMHDLQSSLVGGTQNWALLSNPTNAPVEVQVRAFTALEGTAYTLAPFVIDPFSIYRFRGDGQGLKENPGAVGEPDVPFVRFLFSSNGAFGIRGIRQQFDPSGLLIFMSPHIIRHED